MKKNQVNRVNMFNAVLAVLNNYSSVWLNMPKFSELVGKFKSNILLINQLGEETTSGTTGVTTDKNILKQNMLNATFVLGGKGYWYADDISSDSLKNKFYVEKASARNYRDVELIDLCAAVLTAATDNLVPLADYGVTQAELDALQLLIGEFRASVDTKVIVKTDHRVDLGALQNAIDANSIVIKNKLTPAMRQFKATNPDFYKAYIANKRIVETGGGTKRYFKLAINPNELKMAINYSFDVTSKINFTNTGVTALRVYLSTAANVADSTNFVEVLAGVVREIAVTEFNTDLLTHKYLVVMNMSATENGSCKGKIKV